MGIEELKKRNIVAVIRGAKCETILSIAKALKNGGVTALEITMETPNAARMIEQLTDKYGDELLVGAGTVLDTKTALEAIKAGSKFVFSPIINLDVIKMTKQNGVLSIPGAFTPTEIVTAYQHGADAIKVFPANIVGSSFFKSMSGPLAGIPLMPTGGIDLTNVGEFIKSDVIAVGVGSTLVPTNCEVTNEYLNGITILAKKFNKEIRLAKV